MKYRNTSKNKTYRYVFPMIVDIINYHDNLKGIYIADLEKPQYNNHIFLQYEFSLSFEEAHLKFEEYIQNNNLFEDFYDLNDGSVMFVLKVPKIYKLDYKFFIKSKYSKFSEQLKRKILSFHVPQDREYFKGILYQTKQGYDRLKKSICDVVLRDTGVTEDGDTVLTIDMEFDSKWKEEKEIFNYKNE